MGTHLGPVLAIFFNGLLCNNMLIILYIFLTVKQSFLNMQHYNIKFMLEKEVSFLDVLSTSDGDQFGTSALRKKPKIGLLTNF